MSVDKGVVISFLNKDYELQSWNEQGEITYFEGMLTICFLVVSPCFHRDKKLYLIIRIHYLVNMPSAIEYMKLKKNHEKDKDRLTKLFTEFEKLEKELKEEQERLTKLWNQYKGQEKEIVNLKSEVHNLKTENTELKIENISLKEQLGKVHSNWEKRRDMAWRINPITKKREVYKELPLHFDEASVVKLDFYGDSEYQFRYHFDRNNYEWYTLPISLYDFLCGRKPKIVEEEKSDVKKRIHEE